MEEKTWVIDFLLRNETEMNVDWIAGTLAKCWKCISGEKLLLHKRKFILAQFFLCGKYTPGLILLNTAGKSNQGSFFRGESLVENLCRGKV